MFFFLLDNEAARLQAVLGAITKHGGKRNRQRKRGSNIVCHACSCGHEHTSYLYSWIFISTILSTVFASHVHHHRQITLFDKGNKAHNGREYYIFMTWGFACCLRMATQRCMIHILKVSSYLVGDVTFYGNISLHYLKFVAF